MRRPLLVQLVALGACVALVAASSRFVPGIDRARAPLNILGDAAAVHNAPPEYAFWIQAFGPFRSLITTVMFIRADQYKEQGRYFDALELASLICQLQPHFPAVWEFQAWNMSWNISVTTYTPQERWHWVYNGVKLLRDESIAYNPRAVNLYKQIAWTFFSKMADLQDDYNVVYKKEWAWRMHLLLGAPPSALGRLDTDEMLRAVAFDLNKNALYEATRVQEAALRARARQMALAGGRDPNELRWSDPNAPGNAQPALTGATLRTAGMVLDLQEIVAAAPDLPTLYARVPETRALVTGLRDFGVYVNDDPMTEDGYWRPGGLAFTFFSPYRELADPSMLLRLTSGADTGLNDDLKRFDALVGVRDHRPAGQALVRFLQRKVLREVYKNDPAHMLALVKQFGPIDWRRPESEAVYWASEALIVAQDTPHDFSNDKLNTGRIMLFALQGLARNNRVYFVPPPDNRTGELAYYNAAPDPDFIESMHTAYMRYAPALDTGRGGAGVGDLFSSGHINFLSEGIRILYFANRLDAAQKYYDYLRHTYGRNADGTIRTQYLDDLRDFVLKGFFENVDIERDAKGAITGLLMYSFDELANGDPIVSANLVRQAHEVHQKYTSGREQPVLDRQSLPPFEDMYIDTFIGALTQPAPMVDQMLWKVRLWAAAPLMLRLSGYDAALPELTDECHLYKLDAARAFPEPPGIEQYRQAQPARPGVAPNSGGARGAGRG
jgi:hypothetical protein